MAGMLLSGSLTTIFMKLQNESTAGVDGKDMAWNHPLLQTAMMFFAELLCLAVYYVIYRNKHESE
jgi:hypothetical protein